LMDDENKNFKCSFILYDVEEEELIRNDWNTDKLMISKLLSSSNMNIPR
jgi:hypothetical protein